MSAAPRAARADASTPGGPARAVPALSLLTPRRALPPQHLADLDPAGRRSWVTDLGEPAFRAEQLSRAYFSGGSLSALPAARRAELAATVLPPLLTTAAVRSTDGGATRKHVHRLFDGAVVESVAMRYPGRVTVCVSSQAGCGMACPFCATGQGGLTRNLSAAEIVDQVVAAQHAVSAGALASPAVTADALAELGADGDGAAGPDAAAAGRVSNVVFMGMGEPLANYRRVLVAVRALLAGPPHGLGLSARALTVSTVGVVPAMRQLADEGLPVTLAVSLHAPDDELRDTLVPLNTRYPVAEVLAAAWHYAERTRRRVSIEYALIRDVNDDLARARALAGLLRGRLTHVNLIPLNPTPGSDWDATPRRRQDAFVRALHDAGIPATVRDTRGRDIDGACGQLAAGTA